MREKYIVVNCSHLFCELIPLLFGDLLPSSQESLTEPYLLPSSQEPLTEPYLCQPNSITTLASSTVD